MRAWLWLLVSLLASGTTWVYTHHILVPWEYQVNVASGKVKAQMGDLYPRWVGTRDLLLQKQNPYGPEVSHEIQMGFYGHSVIQTYGQPGRAPVDEQRFAYPVFVVFLLAPTIHMPFSDAQRWAEIVLALLTAASALLWLDFLHWRPSKITTVVIILLVLNTPQILQGLRLGQLGLVVGFLLAAAAWCVKENRLATAGALLAVSTIKPQMVLLVSLWFLLWAASEWRTRWRLLAGFGSMLAVLAGAGELLLPGWIGYFLHGLAAYRKYLPLMSLLELVLGHSLGDIVAAAGIVILLGIAWRNRNQPGDSQQFAIMLASFFLATTLAMPLIPPFNQALLILPVFMLLRDWRALSVAARRVFAFCFAWPWIGAVTLLLFSHRVPALVRLALLPSYVAPLIPFILPVLLLGWRRSLSKPAPVAAL